MLLNNALYSRGLKLVIFQALNDDLTIPIPTRVIAGAGPFDFSGYATPAAIPLSIRLDTDPVETLNIDLSGVGDINAVTAAEVRDAINAAAFTEITASLEAVTNRLQLAYTGTENPRFIQVYGDCAPYAMFGQGFGQRMILSDTMKSIAETPNKKEAEDITDMDANGREPTVTTDSYRKGCKIVAIDTADDPQIRALIDGGTLDDTPPDTLFDQTYNEPTSETTKVYFYMMAFHYQYGEGTNKEGQIENYVMKLYRSCVGDSGEITHERPFANRTYNISATSYTDENSVLFGDLQTGTISVVNYEALDLENL